MNTRILLIFALGLSSCSVFRPSLMLRAGRDFPFAPITDTASPTYRIAPNDIIQFRILSNDGFKLIDFNAFGDNTNWGSQQAINYQTYVIDNDGTAKLPLLGKTSLAGMTLREAEQFLEGIYSTFYNKPFVMVNVTNRRVIIFPGGDGTARVIPLNNPNTTVFEALAMSGGISQFGKARNIKLIRGDLKNPKIFKINLATIKGVKEANLILQANDIIYVEPSLRLSQSIWGELTPIVGILTNIVFIWSFLTLK